MARYINAKQLSKRFMSKNKDKLKLSTIINEIEIAEKGLSREIDVVEVKRGYGMEIIIRLYDELVKKVDELEMKLARCEEV